MSPCFIWEGVGAKGWQGGDVRVLQALEVAPWDPLPLCYEPGHFSYQRQYDPAPTRLNHCVVLIRMIQFQTEGCVLLLAHVSWRSSQPTLLQRQGNPVPMAVL